MNKKLLGVVMASCAVVSMAQARFYVGIEGGYSAQSAYDTKTSGKNTFGATYSGTGVLSKALDNGARGYSVGGVLGTESFFGKYFGLRWGVGAGYTSVSKDKHNFNTVDAGVSLDLLLNFYNNGSFSFGVFGGASADYHYVLDGRYAGSSEHLLDFSGKVGLSTMMAKHHRVEFYAKLPISSMNVTDSKGSFVLGGAYAPARTTLGASYKFVF
ncbi:outer membrane beta-barrel protein [Helicobacter pametensis]|uniref:outer membrane beta-barrel protein n=1 Tax=Helicobacter pametensis TaxID=95149 RepID=UPI000488C8E5|nr:outer membrane beta-barrel protein [Helicobacter pametensis]